MLDVDTTLDLSVLEDLDFPVPCGHSTHGNDPELHDDGDAVVVAHYICPSGVTRHYPVCQRFTRVTSIVRWVCACGVTHHPTAVEWTFTPLVPVE
jgi:hypothetical protein